MIKEKENPNPEVLCVTIRDLETMLGLTRRQIYRRIEKGILKPIRGIMGRNFIFEKKDILDLIKKK